MAGFPGVGSEFGPYAISGVLGRGGMGVVFEATDRRLNRAVALKVLSPVLSEDPQFRSRFEHEAGVLAKLDSPHVVQIFEYGEIDDCLYLAAQLIRGGDLKSHIEAHGPISPALALDLAVQVAEALVDASELGIVHRDIKPSNILLRRRGASLQAYLCDFGIAWTSDSAHTRTGQVVGSVPYMPPEQHEGRRADIRSDVYSLGCVLWDALSGRPPYQGTDIQVAMAHINHPVPQLPGEDAVTAQVNRVLLRALAKDPDDRFQTPEELHAVLSGTLAMARSAAAVETPVRQPAIPGGSGGPPVEPADRSGERPARKRVPRQRRSPAESVPTQVRTATRTDHEPPVLESPRRRRWPVLALAGVLVVGLGAGAAALAGRDEDPGTTKPPKVLRFPAAEAAYLPSTHVGGTIRVGYLAGTIEKDPGRVYTPAGLNVVRFTSRSLMFERETDDGAVVVPDLATGPGEVSDGGRTWTYHLRPGLKYSNDQPITAADVAYGVLRASSTDPSTAGTSPYLGQLLNLPEGWRGQESAGMDTTSAVRTPDDRTIVFRLKKPFYEFDSLMTLPQAAPVPHSADGEPLLDISSGPYVRRTTAQGFTLDRNTHWKPSQDPYGTRQALPEHVEFREYRSAEALKNAVEKGTAVSLAADRSFDIKGAEKVDGAYGLVNYLALNPTIAPFGNAHCRRAVAAVLDLRAVLKAYGGSRYGSVATTLLPPKMPGRATGFDPYDAKSHPHGNLQAARAQMTQCSSPDGFHVNVAYPEVLGDGLPTALAGALAQIHVTVTPVKVPASRSGADTCRSERFGTTKVGICARSWAPDWWSGYGFLAQIADPGYPQSSYNSFVLGDAVDRDFNDGLAEPDPAARQRAWSAIDRELVTDARLVPLMYLRARVSAPDGLTNLVVSRRYGTLDLLRLGVG